MKADGRQPVWRPRAVTGTALRRGLARDRAVWNRRLRSGSGVVRRFGELFALADGLEAKQGSYRTKDTILGIYDEMQEAVRSGGEYRTRLSPEPGDARCCQPARSGKVH